jgi:8-oxo-dGTP diphosphatase
MPKERFKCVIAVFLMLEREGKLFLMRRANTGYMDGLYGLPAGHHDGGEFLKEAMAREAKEELDILINPADLEFIHLVHRPFANDADRLDVYFRCKTWEGEPKNLEPEKCDDMGWFSLKDLPKNLIPKESEVWATIAKNGLYTEYTDPV